MEVEGREGKGRGLSQPRGRYFPRKGWKINKKKKNFLKTFFKKKTKKKKLKGGGEGRI